MAVGEIIMVPIEEILNEWDTVDGPAECGNYDDGNEECPWECCRSSTDKRAGWERLLEKKRNDGHFPDVVDSLLSKGFLRPNTFFRRYGGTPVHGDGHHRLAAAVSIGLTHIPMEERRQFGDKLISHDSGDWEPGCPIHRTVEDAWRGGDVLDEDEDAA